MPWDGPPKPAPSSRGETFGIALVVLLLLSIVFAPMGGSSLLEAIWYLVRH